MKDFYEDVSGTLFFNHSESGVCRFNNAINCNDKTICYTCGWNPAVAELRSQEIRKRLKESGVIK